MEKVNPLHDFQREFSAPLKGITPSAQVGRLSGSHSDIGFQLTQLPGKMVMEPKGEKVGALEDVSTNGLCTSAVHERAAADDDKGNVYGMKTCNHHESKRTDWNSLLKSFPAGTFSRQHGWVFVGPCHPCAHGPPALLSGGNGNSGVEPFGTGGDTHKHDVIRCNYIQTYMILCI